MSPSDYEAYVEALVRQLDLGPEVSVERNARVRGMRQPGEYEIDVVVRARLAGMIDFFMIVECKNWSRPVDRPVVQKLVQTRDAVAAHKAAIASPVGFSREAAEVAQANGVALWVMSSAQWTIVMGSDGPSPVARSLYAERIQFLEDLGFRRMAEGRRSPEPILIAFENARPAADGDWRRAYSHNAACGSALTCGDDEPGVDPRTAASELADAFATLLGIAAPSAIRSRR
jgi:hypothetical protein